MPEDKTPIPINRAYTQAVVSGSPSSQPFVVAAHKDSHSAALLPARQQPLLHPAVRVFGPGDPPAYLFSIPQWEASERIVQGQAREIKTSKKIRGIQVVPRTKAHTLQEQLQQLIDWREPEQHPDLNTKGLATHKQVEGLPVLGDVTKLYYGPTMAQFKKAA